MHRAEVAVYSMKMTQAILIADDHPLFREALGYIVSSAMPGCDIHEATNYQETKDRLTSDNYKLVFLDLNMPDSNGLADLALLKKLYPQTPMVVVSAHEEPSIVRTCLNYNASGYIVKSASPEQIKNAITTILKGDIYLPDGIDLSNTDEDSEDIDAAKKVSSLTPSQLKVLMEMGKGKLNKQIAYDLDITEATVKAHITSVFKKLQINNRTQAVLFAKEHQTKIPELGGH